MHSNCQAVLIKKRGNSVSLIRKLTAIHARLSDRFLSLFAVGST